MSLQIHLGGLDFMSRLCHLSVLFPFFQDDLEEGWTQQSPMHSIWLMITRQKYYITGNKSFIAIDNCCISYNKSQFAQIENTPSVVPSNRYVTTHHISQPVSTKL